MTKKEFSSMKRLVSRLFVVIGLTVGLCMIAFMSAICLMSLRIKNLEDQIISYQGTVIKWEKMMGFDNADSWIRMRASHFGKGDGLMGKAMYSGVKVDEKTLFFASRNIPMGTKAHIYNPRTGKQAVGQCLDWGPAKWTGKDIDLGPALASRLGFTGIGPVRVRILQ